MRDVLVRVGVIIATLAYCLYSYIDRQNSLTALRMEISDFSKDINRLKEENERLTFEVERFENPSNLLKLSRSPQYAHLKHPFVDNVLKVKEGLAINNSKTKEVNSYSSKHSVSLAVGR